MKYLYVPKGSDSLKGDLYEYLNKTKKKIKSGINLKKPVEQKIAAAIICQYISEGKSLKAVLAFNVPSFPSLAEFYEWVNRDIDIASWFQEAQLNRNQTLIEEYYNKLEKMGDLTDDSLKQVVSYLKRISEYQQKDQDRGSKVIVRTNLWGASDKLTKGYDE